MSADTNVLPTQELSKRWQRELQKGETVYHSTSACHVSSKFPDGKWIGMVRREVGDKLVRYPVKGFGTPREAVEYVKSLRPQQPGQGTVVRPGEPTVTALYDFVTTHKQRRLAQQTKKAKLYRWNAYIKPEWGEVPISRVTRRAAQEWLTYWEEALQRGDEDAPPLSQLIKVRTDLIALFEGLGTFASNYEDRRNPFADLDFTPLPPRMKVTVESQHFPAIHFACRYLAEHGFVSEWIVEMFLASLLSGLRQGEVMALCADQIDFGNGAILIDRAMRKQSRPIDPVKRQEFGDIRLQAMNLPKGGTATRDKRRLVPMSASLADALKKALRNKPEQCSDWDLIWPSATGEIRDQSHFTSAWKTLRLRLHEVATLAPIAHSGDWPEAPKQRGWKRNPLIELAKANARLRLPNIFGHMDFRDTRNSFASYTHEIGIAQASREEFLGHGGKGITNSIYTSITTLAFQDARLRMDNAWQEIKLDDELNERAA